MKERDLGTVIYPDGSQGRVMEVEFVKLWGRQVVIERWHPLRKLSQLFLVR